MIVSNSQNIQSSNPLDSISSRRVNGESRSSKVDTEDKQAQKAQQQQDDSIVRQLRVRDREVRAHEGAHVAAGGALVRGGPSYTYQTGPDGRAYAIGGEVQIDVSAVANDPSATLIKTGQIKAAALAPANPSSQDLRVAANANQLASRARVEIAVLRREEAQLDDNQQRVETATQSPDDGSNSSSDASGVNSMSGGVDNPIESTAASAFNAASNLQSSDVPIAAISAFIASAETTAKPVQFSQFA